MLKKKAVSIQLIIILICIQLIPTKVLANTINPLNNFYEPPEHSTEELYKDIFSSLLIPYIQRSVNDYYSKLLTDIPTVDPWDIDIISVERPYGYRTFIFLLTIEVKPYVSSHIGVGVDRLTITIAGDGHVTINKFEHIKDYELPPFIKVKKKVT